MKGKSAIAHKKNTYFMIFMTGWTALRLDESDLWLIQ